MKYALIDMGSNSIRLTVYELKKKEFRILFKKKVMAGLAGYVENGELTPEGIECACRSLQYFQRTLKSLKIRNISVFATASLRNVTNTEQAVKLIHEETGIDVEVLSGEEEASYGYYGASVEVKEEGGVFVDIGGASTEIVLFEERKIKKAESVPLGSLKLFRDCVKDIMPDKESQQRIEKSIAEAFEKGNQEYMPVKQQIIGVGGTIRACLRLCRVMFGLQDECRSFTKEQLEELAECLCKNDRYARNLILRNEPERIHTLVPGVLLLRYMMKRYDISKVVVSRFGVREGYLRQKIQPRVK